MTQNNHLVGARLDRTRTSRIRYLSGEFQFRGEIAQQTQAGRLALTSLLPGEDPELALSNSGSTWMSWLLARLAVVLWAFERNSGGPRMVYPGPFARLRFFLWSSGASPISPLLEKRAGKIDFFPGLPGILVSVVCRGQCCSGESLACFFPARPGWKKVKLSKLKNYQQRENIKQFKVKVAILGLLFHVVVLFPVSLGISIPFSIVDVWIYLPTNSARGFPFHHILWGI